MTSIPALSTSTLTVALVGNPNTGKSTIFNALTGLHQHVGNYPGVTVEKRTGRFEQGGRRVQLIDLPGTYSLAARSADEWVAVDVLTERSNIGRIDVIVVIVDANNLERNLFLFTQVAELGRPIVAAVNMIDLAERNGIAIDWNLLTERLGIPVVPLQANKGRGLRELKEAIVQDRAAPDLDTSGFFPAPVRDSVQRIASELDGSTPSQARFLARRLLFDPSTVLAQHFPQHPGLPDAVQEERQRLVAAGFKLSSLESLSRYAWIERFLQGIVRRPAQRVVTISDRIDAVLTHRLWGTLIFATVILLMFQAVFAWSQPLIGWIETGFSAVQSWLTIWLPAGALQSLIVQGVLGGISGVLVFLPQILILFFFIALLEDCGYLARAAYLMDRLMSRVGLSGKSFIPLLSSFACAIPGVMATRIIENPRDRLVTILVAPLMSCSARLPVYTLLIAAFVPKSKFLGGWLTLQGLTLFALYLIGIVVAAGVAILLKLTLLRGETPPFVMELPEYKTPSWRQVLRRMSERGWAFVRRAGTLIVSVSILIWAATYFPRTMDAPVPPPANTSAAVANTGAVPAIDPTHLNSEGDEAAAAAAQIRNSYLGRSARTIEPLVRPLGWDWKIAAAVIASFPAREIFVAALGVLYSLGEDQNEESETLRERLQNAKFDGTDRPIYTLPTALSLLVFFALCAQCFSTLVVIGRETNSWRWPVFTFVYMTSLAYLAALVVYQVGTRL